MADLSHDRPHHGVSATSHRSRWRVGAWPASGGRSRCGDGVLVAKCTFTPLDAKLPRRKRWDLGSVDAPSRAMASACQRRLPPSRRVSAGSCFLDAAPPPPTRRHPTTPRPTARRARPCSPRRRRPSRRARSRRACARAMSFMTSSPICRRVASGVVETRRHLRRRREVLLQRVGQRAPRVLSLRMRPLSALFCRAVQKRARPSPALSPWPWPCSTFT